MPMLFELEETAAFAVDAAVADLEERGVDPADAGRLLTALANAVVQAGIAFHSGRDVREYRDVVDAVYQRLDARPLIDRPPPPARRTLSPRLLDEG